MRHPRHLPERAQHMRKHLTPSEAALWRELAGGKLGVRFVRQLVIGRFIVDFAAPVARLVVEVDGGYHAERAVADARRDRVLARAGYRVLRLEAELVMREMPEALRRVRDAL
jgi:very-short-patch-repair endonuclease